MARIRAARACQPLRWSRLALAATLLVCLAAAGLVVSSENQETPPPPSRPAANDDALPDPLPLRRVVLPLSRVAAELERARQGVLVKQSRAEFEALVARAARAEEAARNPPRLVETRYRCSFADNALSGRASWVIVNPSSAAALLPFPSLSLALRQARFNNTEAILGELDGKGQAVLLDSPGKHELALEWSARGEVRPGGVHFSLRVPPCALQSLELETPEGQIVAVSRDVGLLSGPSPAETVGRVLWRLDCAGKQQLDLVVRPAPGAGEPTLVLARQHTEQTLTPGAADAQYTLHLEVVRGAVRELRCICDAGLQPFRVAAGDQEIESWEHTPGPSHLPTSLVIRLREAVLGPGTLTVIVQGLMATAPEKQAAKTNRGSLWTCPGLHLEGAVPRGETLVLRVPADVRLTDWRSGRFTLRQSGTEEGGTYVLTLQSQVDGLPPPAASKAKAKGEADVVRPQARLALAQAEFHTEQQCWWQVGAADQTLTAHIHFRVTRGRLHRLSLQTPAWTVEAVDVQGLVDGRDLATADLVRTWTASGDAGSGTLLVDLLRSLGPGSQARLGVRLRQTHPKGAGPPASLGFPVLAPHGARVLDGTLAVGVAPTFRASAAASESEVAPEALPGGGVGGLSGVPPWGQDAPDFCYAFRGQPVTGSLTLQSRRAQVHARGRSQVSVDGSRARVEYDLRLQPVSGTPQSVDLSWSLPPVAPLVWSTPAGDNPIRRAEPTGEGGGQVWRLLLAQPLREPLSLRAVLNLDADRQLRGAAAALAPLASPGALPTVLVAAAGQADSTGRAGERLWNVPLPIIVGAERMEGEVALHTAEAGRFEVEARGLTESAVAGREPGPKPWREYRYEQLPLNLTVREKTESAEVPQGASVERVQLTSRVRPEGDVVHHFTCRLRNWNGRSVPVEFSAGARILALKVNGRWAPALTLTEGEAGNVRLTVPLPTGVSAHELEADYVTPYTRGMVWSRVAAPLPLLPGSPAMVLRTWQLPPGQEPLVGRIENPSYQTEWESVAGQAGVDTLIMIRPDRVRVLALGLTAFILLAAWGARDWSGRRRLGFVLTVLAGGLLSLLWLPDGLRELALGPTVAALLCGVVWYLRSLREGAAPGRSEVVRKLGVAGLLGLLLAGMLSGQGEDVPTTVWLLPNAAETSVRGDVLAPPELLTRLETMARRGVHGLSGVVLLGGAYEGQVEGGVGEFVAEFRVWCFAEDGPADLLLPLGGVELRETLLDGAPAFPTALALPRIGYSIRVGGRGAHTLRVRFVARVQAGAEENELRFVIPRLARSRLTLHVRPPAPGLQAVLGPQGGAQRVASEEAASLLEADLGRSATLHVRWRAGREPARPAEVEAKEAYVWHLRGTGSRLHGVIQYAVKRGALAALALEVPPGLEVTRVEAGPVSSRAAAARLAGWRVVSENERRLLHLDFQGLVTDAVQVEMEMVPARPLTASATLTPPAPLGVASASGFLAVSVEGLEAAVANHLGLAAVGRDTFLESWKAAGLADPGPLPFRYRFRRGADGSPLLRVNLLAGSGRVHAVQSLDWNVGQSQADLHAVARLQAEPGEELSLVEWEVPAGLSIADVRGPHVRGWSHAAGRLQLWLQRGQRETPLVESTLELFAALPRSAKDATFVAPRLRLAAPPRQTTFLRVAVPEDQLLDAAASRGWLPLPEPRQVPHVRSYVSREEPTAIAFRIVPSSAGPQLRMLTLLEVRERGLHFVTTIDCRMPQDTGRSLLLRLRDWDGADVRLETSPAVVVRDLGRSAQRQTWVAELRPGPAESQQLRLSGSRPFDGEGPLTVPDVTVIGMQAERWLAVAGPEVKADAVRGLKASADVPVPPGAWAGALDRVRRAGGSLWRVDAADWEVRVHARPGRGAPAPIQVIWSEHGAALASAGRWLCESLYWFHQEAAAKLDVRLPPRATLLAAWLDGQELGPHRDEGDRLVVALPRGWAGGRSGGWLLRLRWLTEPGGEWDRPPLAVPRIEGAAGGPTFWTIYSPAGFRVLPVAAANPSSAAAFELHRAQGQLLLSGLLARRSRAGAAEPGPQDLKAAQERFYQHCRAAESMLARGAEQPGGPQGQSLVEWLRELREQNRQAAQANQFERLRAQAEKQALAAGASETAVDNNQFASRSAAATAGPFDEALGERGTPTFWEVRPESADAALRLEAADASTLWRRWLWTLLVAAGAAVAWRLYGLPALTGILRRCVPEQLMALGLLLWFAIESPLPAVLTFGTGVALRVFLLGRWLRTLRQPLRPALQGASSFKTN